MIIIYHVYSTRLWMSSLIYLIPQYSLVTLIFIILYFNSLLGPGSVPHMVRGTPFRGMRGSNRYMTHRSPLPRQPAPPRLSGTTAPPRQPGSNAPPRLPGTSAPRQPGSTPLRLPVTAPVRLPASPRLPGTSPTRLLTSTTPRGGATPPRLPGMRPSSPRLSVNPRLPNSPGY